MQPPAPFPLYRPGDKNPPSDPSRLGLIWGFDFTAAGAIALEPATLETAVPNDVFRWLHLNLADQWTRRWIVEHPGIAAPVRELLLSADRHQQALIYGDTIACLVHDFERDFDDAQASRTGVLAFMLTPRLMITARHHPLRAADVIHRRIGFGTCPDTPAAALDLLLGAIAEVAGRVAAELTLTVQAAEDALLDHGRAPDPRALVDIRRRAVQLHRQIAGLRAVLHLLEVDDDLPEAVLPQIEKLLQRFVALDADVLAIQGNLRQLREEIDMATTSRTNQNLYILSLLTALLLPPTLVTGFFGMNTGGMPFAGENHGTFVAALAALAAALGVFFWLRARSFFKR